jgi:hypothetical protein
MVRHNHPVKHNHEHRPRSSGRSMLIFWAIASLIWLWFSAYMFHLDQVGSAWRQYGHYEIMIQNGEVSDYTRQAYLRAGARLDQASKNILMFLIVGMGLPAALLSFGVWLIRRKPHHH